MTQDIFEMSNVRIFKKIEKRKMGDVYTLLCIRSDELSKAFGLRNLCYSKISEVMLLGCRIAGISRKLESETKKMPCAQILHIKIASVIHAWFNKSRTAVEFIVTYKYKFS